jgi:hypothetical protein
MDRRAGAYCPTVRVTAVRIAEPGMFQGRLKRVADRVVVGNDKRGWLVALD